MPKSLLSLSKLDGVHHEDLVVRVKARIGYAVRPFAAISTEVRWQRPQNSEVSSAAMLAKCGMTAPCASPANTLSI